MSAVVGVRGWGAMDRADYVSAVCAVFAASISPAPATFSDLVPVVHFLPALLSESGENQIYIKSLVLVVYYAVSLFGVPSVRPLTPFVFFAADVGYAVWFLSENGRVSVGGVLPALFSGAASGAHAFRAWRRWYPTGALPPRARARATGLSRDRGM